MIRRAEGKTQAGNLLPVAGHIEIEETPIEACVREVKEETGYEISPRCVAIIFNVIRGRQTGYKFTFIAEAPDLAPKLCCPECTLEWIDIDEMSARSDIPPLDRELLPMFLSARKPLLITLDVDTDKETYVRSLRRVDQMDV